MDHQGKREIMVTKDMMVPLDHQEKQDLKVLLDTKEYLVYLDHLDPKDLLEHQVEVNLNKNLYQYSMLV
jgi:hypothetical protein